MTNPAQLTTEKQTNNFNEDNILPENKEDIDKSEQQVLNHIMGVSMKSQKYDGLCGKITKVELVKDKNISEEHKQFMKKLSQYTENNSHGIDPNAEDKITESQKQLRKSLDLEPGDTPNISVTVELPDGRTFDRIFDAPQFDSDKVDNEFMELYKNVLGNNIKNRDEIVGCWVPIKRKEDNDISTYDIDTERVKSKDKNSSKTLSYELDELEMRLIKLVSVTVLFVLSIVYI